MEGCGNFIKYSLFVVNIITFIGGILIASLGIWTVADKSFSNELLGTNLYIGVAYVLIISGVLASFISCVGCVGSVKEVRCLLVTYFISLFLIFVTMLIAGILGFVFREKAELTVRNGMQSSLSFYGNYYPVTYAWTETQRRLMCCGVNGYRDWNDNVPDSCCKLIQGRVQRCSLVEVKNDAILYRRGCLDVTIDYVKDNAIIISIIGIIEAFIMMLGIIFSYVLFKMIK